MNWGQKRHSPHVLWDAERSPEAEAMLREVLIDARAQSDFVTAYNVTSDLLMLLTHQGRLDEALDLCEEGFELTHQGTLGRWAELVYRQHKLTLLNMLGRTRDQAKQIALLTRRIGRNPRPTSQFTVKRLDHGDHRRVRDGYRG